MWFKKRPLETSADEERTARDPVCGMDLIPEKASATRQVAGDTFYFCSEHCVRTFDEAPDYYARTGDQPEEHA